ncbi:hypothetical protein DN752_21790 [Echinicola strongylocentroti]|uniref:CHRD domain-containing protein n=1 Tax=Echinicola strongylocentroti TaxID=1795355 RepID=A0A2Z4IP50_9BACT|nr:hypothetical protein [Echinicola strongylocentroti]AWW32567.1 hypothetical protein DN752_21790 [Echinicola strongylocentroti]
MKKLIGLLILVSIFFSSCSELEDSLYEKEALAYDLQTVSAEYGYSGEATFRQFSNGSGLEITIQLFGEASEDEYYFPAHLHFGPYEEETHAGMAEMLSSVDIRPLKSVTVLEGYTLADLKENEYHIKVHLAADGPEYDVILVAGNVGKTTE